MSQGLKIASGWNVGSGSLVDITAVTDGTNHFADPKSQYFYTPGQRLIRADGSVYNAGFAEVTWQFGIMFFNQLYYLQQTYCSGGWSGQVTILTNTLNPVSFSRLNAQMILPQPSELKAQMGWYVDVPVKFTMLLAAS